MTKDIKYATSMRFRVDRHDPAGRIFISVFCGSNHHSRAKVGELVLEVDEFQRFFGALEEGTKMVLQSTPEATHVPLEVTVTGRRMAFGCDDITDEIHFPIKEPPWTK